MSVVIIGASGAVGGAVLQSLSPSPELGALTLLGRRRIEAPPHAAQHVVDLGTAASYAHLLPGHNAAVCTVGVGEPSKVDRATFVRIDQHIPLRFAQACKAAGIRHFSLLSSVGVSPSSTSFHLRCKGELEEELKALQFERLSLFHPSMILTPQNRYGFSQGIALRTWPWLRPVLRGSLRKFRGIPVGTLGRAIAANLHEPGAGTEVLEWDDFERLGALTPPGSL